MVGRHHSHHVTAVLGILRMYLSCRVFFSFASQYVSFLCVVLMPGKTFSRLLLWLHLRRLDRV